MYQQSMMPSLGLDPQSQLQEMHSSDLQEKAMGKDENLRKRQLQLQLASLILGGLFGSGGLAGALQKKGGGGGDAGGGGSEPVTGGQWYGNVYR